MLVAVKELLVDSALRVGNRSRCSMVATGEQ
jgi:hypothetical protein